MPDPFRAIAEGDLCPMGECVGVLKLEDGRVRCPTCGRDTGELQAMATVLASKPGELSISPGDRPEFDELLADAVALYAKALAIATTPGRSLPGTERLAAANYLITGIANASHLDVDELATMLGAAAGGFAIAAPSLRLFLTDLCEQASISYQEATIREAHGVPMAVRRS
jgi:hypothetical protein